MEIPKHDPRSYSSYTLPSGLRVVIVSDPTAKERAAAAMTVNVGHCSDPASAPGLAHFLEHMLFQGSEKYPGCTTYKDYLSSHGGSTNASTSAESTTYKFAVDERFFGGALDIWAQFFLAPRLERAFAEREVNIVNAENAKNLRSDARRFYQLKKEGRFEGVELRDTGFYAAEGRPGRAPCSVKVGIVAVRALASCA